MRRFTTILALLGLFTTSSLSLPGQAFPRLNGRMVVPVPVTAQAIPTEVPALSASEDQKYQALQTVIARLKSANQLSPHIGQNIVVEESTQLNAATDGQTLYITRGMLNALTRDDQMAFVISHELSHITLNHIPKTALRRGGWQLLDQGVLSRIYPSGSIWDVAEKASITLLEKKFSRNSEYQADTRGLAMMTQAGYDPQAAIEVLNLLQASSPNSTPEFLQDHPLNKARIETLVDKYKLQKRTQ